MRSSDIEIRVDGTFLSRIATWGDLEWSERFDGGCWEASWTMEVPEGWHHPAIRRGAIVEVLEGPVVLWTGLLAEPDRESWEMTATGLVREAERYTAIDAMDKATRRVNVATLVAELYRGLPWEVGTLGALLPSWPSHADPVQSDQGGLWMLDELWDAAAEAAGWHWGVGPDRLPYAVPEPTEPTWRMTPGSGTLGLADDEYASHLVGRYYESATTLATSIRGNDDAAERWGRTERAVDLTGRGTLTASKVDAILDGMLEASRPRPGFSNALEPGPYDLTTLGGVPAHLPHVRAGQRVRLHGVQSEDLVPLPYVDFTIGEVRHEAGAESVYIEPLGLAASNLQAVLEGRS